MSQQHQRWEADFAARAAAYWTDARVRALVGDRRPAILPSEAPLLLRSLGLLHRDGSMPPDRVRKYRQINHMVAVLQPTLKALMARAETVRLIDAACGRSYLSTLVAWVFRHRYQHPVEILAVDYSSALVAESARRADKIGLSDIFKTKACPLGELDVVAAWQEAYGGSGPVHGVLSLHACNTATDDAIVLGVRLGAHAIAVVPCCQAELAAGWAKVNDPATGPGFASIRSEPHLRRELAAHVTDVMRVNLLRACGYTTGAIEFVPMEHTAKNTLVRAVLTGARAWDDDAWADYAELVRTTGGVGIGLADRLRALFCPEQPAN